MPRTVLVLLLLLPACASLEPIDPEAMQHPGDLTRGVAPLPLREHLEYLGTWNGIPAGEAIISYERRSDAYLSRARLGTIGLVSLLYGVTMVAEAESDADDLLSRRWAYETEGADPDKRVQVRYAPETGKVVSVIRQDDDVERIILDAPGALDPLGLFIALRRATLETGQAFVTDIFSERKVYEAMTLVMDRERVRVPIGQFDTVLVRTDVRGKADGQPPNRARGMGIYYTDDELRIPVRMDVDTKLGRIVLRLTKYERGWPQVTSGRGTPPE